MALYTVQSFKNRDGYNVAYRNRHFKEILRIKHTITGNIFFKITTVFGIVINKRNLLYGLLQSEFII